MPESGPVDGPVPPEPVKFIPATGFATEMGLPLVGAGNAGNRKKERIDRPDEPEKIYSLRRAMQGVPIGEAMEMFVQRSQETESNAEFLVAMNR